MIPPEVYSQENLALAWKHLQPETDTVATKTTRAVQNIWWETFLQIDHLIQENSTFASNHIYGDIVYEESDNEEPVEADTSTEPTDAKQSPPVETISEAWESYSEKWFYSYPFSDES